MQPLLLKAKPVADQIKSELKSGVADFKKSYGRAPKLVVVLVGEDPASVIYTTKKGEAATAVDFDHETLKFPESTKPAELKSILERLNHDPKVDGILIQRPLPKGYKEEEVLFWVDPAKDVDAFHPENVGRLHAGLPGLISCTPLGVMELLRHYKIPTEGKTAVVIGRSNIVGKPMAALLLKAHATVVQCHSRTCNLTEFTEKADILVAAAGIPQFIKAENIRKGAVVIDVGIHRTETGKLVGDVDFEGVSRKASAITPVPGGVGPMTIAMLLKNTLDAALRREEK